MSGVSPRVPPVRLVWKLRGCEYSAPYSFSISDFVAPMHSFERFTESVRIYVIIPLSYSRCATIIVCETVKPSLRAASCCSVEVVKGGAGERWSGLCCMSPTVKAASRQRVRKWEAAS